MACVHGAGTVVGAGEESNHGTAVARSVWWDVSSASGETQANIIDAPRLFDPLFAVESFSDAETTQLTLSGDVHYEGLGMLWKHALGAVSTTGAGPYDHEYTCTLNLPAGLTLEVLQGSATNSRIYEGCVVASLDLSWQQGSAMQWTATLDCETRNEAAAGTPSTPTYSPVLTGHLNSTSQLTWNSVAYAIESFSLTLNNNLDTARRELDSKFRKQPCRAGRPTVEVTITRDYNDQDAFIDGQQDGTQADMTLTVDPSASTKLIIKLANAKIVSTSMPKSSAGRLVETVVLRGYADASEEALTITVTNNQASGTA